VIAILGIEMMLLKMSEKKKEMAGDDPAKTFLKESQCMKMVTFSQD
jgi:hypothetical protein